MHCKDYKHELHTEEPHTKSYTEQELHRTRATQNKRFTQDETITTIKIKNHRIKKIKIKQTNLKKSSINIKNHDPRPPRDTALQLVSYYDPQF